MAESKPSKSFYSLKWNNFSTHLSKGISQIFGANEQFTDVTLSCEGKFIKAHKLVLSLCSPYFAKIFEESKASENYSNTLVILANTSYEDLHSVLTFIYKGQANVKQTQLNSFLHTAELLQIEGLATNNQSDAIPTPKTENFSSPEKIRCESKKITVKDENSEESLPYISKVRSASESSPSPIISSSRTVGSLSLSKSSNSSSSPSSTLTINSNLSNPNPSLKYGNPNPKNVIENEGDGDDPLGNEDKNGWEAIELEDEEMIDIDEIRPDQIHVYEPSSKVLKVEGEEGEEEDFGEEFEGYDDDEEEEEEEGEEAEEEGTSTNDVKRGPGRPRKGTGKKDKLLRTNYRTCPYCKSQFYRTNLSRHISTVHTQILLDKGAKLLRCGVCRKVFKGLGPLQSHVQKHHFE